MPRAHAGKGHHAIAPGVIVVAEPVATATNLLGNVRVEKATRAARNASSAGSKLSFIG